MILIGIGKQIKKVAQQGPYTVSFVTYDDNLPATQTGDNPVISPKMAGETFILPDQGNLVRTEITYMSPPGGGTVQHIPTNITLYGWSDGNGIYLPGGTYTMPSNDITIYAIWNTLYAPGITSINPNPAAPGTVVDIYGYGFALVDNVKFNRNKYVSSFTILSDNHIRTTVPAGAINGNVIIYTSNGNLASFFGFTTA